MRPLRALLLGTFVFLGLGSLHHAAWSQLPKTIKVLISVPPGGSIDLLVRVRTLDGRPLLIHVEIEARASRGMAERLWRYRSQIQARYDARVLTIAFFLKRGRPGVNLMTWASSLGPDFPEPRYLSFGLKGGRAADYLDRPEPLAWALAELKMACLRRIAGLKGRIDAYLLVDCVENYLELKPWEVAEFKALYSQRENQEVRAMKMTWSETQQAMGWEKGRREGKDEGRREGVEEGTQRGARQVLLLLLGKRFGPLPEPVRRRVEAIDSLDLLTRLAERLLSAHSLDDMGLA